MPKISVVIPAHNAVLTLVLCLEALREQSLLSADYEVIVVDDGSTDGTRELVCRHGVGLVTQARAGPAAARNRGAQEARGEILLFTDADCIPTYNWIAEMTRPFTDPEVVGVRGAYLTRQREPVARFVQLEYEDRYDRMVGRERIDFIDTYSAGYRREVYLANSGFDATFPTASVEDQEFSFRLARKGYKLVFAPQAQVYHLHDVSLWKYARRKFWIGYWKALVTRWHPERLVSDSHTPQVVKVQMLLVGLAILALAGSLFWPPLLGAAGSAIAMFLLSGAPFVLKVATKDRTVAMVSPLLLLVRAHALAAGFLLGTIRFLTAERGKRKAPLVAHQRAIKRTMDLVGGLLGLVLSAPLMAFIALLIKLDSPGPVFYAQERVGEGGKVFRMYKFRSMVDRAEGMRDDLIESRELCWPVLKIRDDPRVTRVGRILRRTSLDEIPQFWNVLKGEMSLVGPRPEEVRIVCLYNDWHRQRLAVKPGMTGPMQIEGRGDLSLDERVKLEIDYIAQYSLLKDIQTLLQTIPAIIQGNGAY